MIAGINEWKTLTNLISCECKCKFDGRKCNSDQWWKNNKCVNVSAKNSYMWKRLSLQCWYVQLPKRKIFSKYYGWFSNYLCICDELYTKMKKNLTKKIQFVKHKISIFYLLFINYHYIIDNCLYILLSDIISNKTFITISWHRKLKQIYIDNINLKWVIKLKIKTLKPLILLFWW